MTDKDQLPTTLTDAIRQFSNEDTCIQFIAMLRWPDGAPVCPKCNHEGAGYLKTQRRWKCKFKECRKQFSVKVGTIFEDSPVKLSDWLAAVWMIVNCKNGQSSYELGRAIGVTQKTAWFMLQRIRLAMQSGSFEKFSGVVEVDETFIGGLARNMHKGRRMRVMDTGHKGKLPVLGLIERNEKGSSRVRTQIINNRSMPVMQGQIRKNVAFGSSVYTDEHRSYKGLDRFNEFWHGFVNHAHTYVNGSIHTNGMENFRSLLKRMIKGTYVSVEPFHMFRYLDEEVFRFNERKDTDLGRFLKAMTGIAGKRLTYAKLTGKDGLPEPVQP